MAQIDIPFRKEFERPMLDDVKICTSRNDRYGEVGDTFEAFGATFRLTEVSRHTLRWIARNLWQAEGCESPQDFIAVWVKLHRRGRAGWTPEKVVWVHWFERVEGGGV